MGASGSVIAIVPTPLEALGGQALPLAYRHLGAFPVLAKCARGPVKPHPNERVTHFLKEYPDAAARVADFLCVRDRLAFLQTHKVGLPPKLLKPLLFSGPSREMGFLYCGSSAGSGSGSGSSNPSSPTATGLLGINHHKQSSSSSSKRGLALGSSGHPTGAAMAMMDKASAASLTQCLQLEVRYRGSFLSRAVPTKLVAAALHRVIRSWLDNKLGRREQGEGFAVIMAMVNRLLGVFRPTESVWYAVVNTKGADGTTLLTYAVANPEVPLAVIEQLLEVPCFDLGLPDDKHRLNPIQLAHRTGRHDVLTFFASLVASV